MSSSDDADEETLRVFDQMTRDAADVQRETLRRILAENAAAEYLQATGLAGRTDPGSFLSCVPLATHADLEPYIQRVADGDTSPVLTAKPITSMSLSSGTTEGKRKYLPFNGELVKSTIQTNQICRAFRNRVFPIEDGKLLLFICGSQQLTTTGGLTATTVSSNVYRSNEFRAAMRGSRLLCSSPSEVTACTGFEEAIYCHLLCGLLFADEVQVVSAAFAHSLVLALQTLDRVWEELCSDIRHGVLSPARVATPAVRLAVSALLTAGPNPQLADAVARRCAGLGSDGWRGVIPVLWPNARYVHAIMTGSMEHYVRKLRHYAGGLPLVAAKYVSSEGHIGVNTEPEVPPERATFTVLPDVAYFEFIPLRQGLGGAIGPNGGWHDVADPVGLTDVVGGEHYEVVMTTFAGLYRYRMGDVVKVVGFYHSTPKLKFVCRRSLILSINVDKNSEQDLQLAVDSAAKLLATERLEVVDYTSHADMSSDPGHYVIFWELNGGSDNSSAGVLQQCCDQLDRAFAAEAGYAVSRKTCAIGPLELRVLRRGTFEKVLRHCLAFGTQVSQFKLPRCIVRANTGVLQVLSCNTVKAFFSTAYN